MRKAEKKKKEHLVQSEEELKKRSEAPSRLTYGKG